MLLQAIITVCVYRTWFGCFVYMSTTIKTDMNSVDERLVTRLVAAIFTELEQKWWIPCRYNHFSNSSNVKVKLGSELNF